MSCSTIAYPTAKKKGSGTRFRLTPLPFNERLITPITLTTAGAIAADAETLTITQALTKPLWAGDILEFSDGTTKTSATLADSVTVGDTVLKIVPLVGAIASGANASTIGSVYVAGVTNLSLGTSPTTTTTADLLSGNNSETSVTGTAHTIPLTMNQIANCPGQGILKDLLYTEKYQEREVFAEIIDNEGEYHAGAAVLTAGNKDFSPNTDATMTCTLALNGCSIVFKHATGFNPVAWPTL